MTAFFCHREERSDEAISIQQGAMLRCSKAWANMVAYKLGILVN
jgi:hypothetical protein